MPLDYTQPPFPDNWLALVTSEYNQQPSFMAMMAGLLQPLADLYATIESIPSLFDLDTAVGDQLDKTGQWIGVTRYLSEPLTGVYFSWGVAGVGWGQGVWHAPGTPTTELVALNDADYRILLYATAAANNWDGTIPGAYDVWNTLFAGTGLTLLIFDFQDMTIGLALVGSPTAVQQALFQGGYLNLVPAGVGVRWYAINPAQPYFYWGVSGSGWGQGYWLG
jgi:hypothetical protein